jgi:hypothetical protein
LDDIFCDDLRRIFDISLAGTKAKAASRPPQSIILPSIARGSLECDGKVPGTATALSLHVSP